LLVRPFPLRSREAWPYHCDDTVPMARYPGQRHWGSASHGSRTPVPLALAQPLHSATPMTYAPSLSAPLLSRPLWLCACLLLAPQLLSACIFNSDACERHHHRCADNVIQVCESACSEPGCGARWIKEHTCPTSCVEDEDEGEALCALSAKPDDHCADRRSDEVCDGTRYVSCWHGFVLDARVCSDACVSPSSGRAFCAISSNPDPRCSPEGDAAEVRFCADKSVAGCHSGYGTVFIDCVAHGLSCQTSADGTSARCQ
jgi:hypothetical protein